MVVSTSGALVVYAPELLRASNAELFHSTPAERPVDFTCEGFAGYTPWLSSPAPVADLTPFAEMTWCAVLLAIAGLALVFLAVTASFIWWPGIRKWRNAFRLRWRRGRLARDFDLHNVIGMPAEDAEFYSIDLLDGGPNLWANNAVYEGNLSVGVDADAENVRVFLGPSPTVSY